MKKMVAYLKKHRREKIHWFSLLMMVMSGVSAVLNYQRGDNLGHIVAGPWFLMLLLYLYNMFFTMPGDKRIDYAAQSARAEADLTAALAGCDDDALRKIIEDPLRGEDIKARAKALLAEREQGG